jgi:hypothetical protein
MESRAAAMAVAKWVVGAKAETAVARAVVARAADSAAATVAAKAVKEPPVVQAAVMAEGARVGVQAAASVEEDTAEVMVALVVLLAAREVKQAASTAAPPEKTASLVREPGTCSKAGTAVAAAACSLGTDPCERASCGKRVRTYG